MKNPTIIAKDKIAAAREWVFQARHFTDSQLRGIFALLIVSGVFALFAATVRIRVSAPQQWVERKASIIQLPAEGDGKIWALRAQESGPFPFRDRSLTMDSGGLADAVVSAIGFASVPYQPILRELPEAGGIARAALAAKDERVFPKRIPKAESPPPAVETRLTPTIFGIAADLVPENLPPFEGVIDPAMASISWKFLLRLRPDGSISESTSIVDRPGGEAIAKWLLDVNFGPVVAKNSPWLSLEVGFTNQPAHGPDAR